MQRNEALQHQLDEEVPYRMVWQNSNKLLGIEGFKGVKTGITQTAGPCLCILYENTQHKHKLITVVLGCQNIDYRFRDARRLALWADNMIVDKAKTKKTPVVKQGGV
jgi:D-alanyl-D-alanine carboxypeptidase